VSGPVEKTLTLETGNKDREANMWKFAEVALGLLEDAVLERPGTEVRYGAAKSKVIRKQKYHGPE